MLDEIRKQLRRLAAHDVVVSLDEEFEPEAGPLVKVEIDGAYWHIAPQELLVLLEGLPDADGAGAIHRAIEKRGLGVWRGPAPEDDRDTPL